MFFDRKAMAPAYLYTRTNQVILDASVFAVSLAAACLLRSESWLNAVELHQLLVWLPVVVLARIAAHHVLGVYRLVWRFVSISDAVKITRSIGSVSVMFLAIALCYPRHAAFAEWVRIPVVILVFEGLLSLISSLGIRALRRMQYAHERKMSSLENPTKRAFLYGAGRAGLMLRKEMENSPSYDVAGFIDDDPLKVGSVISDTPVVGNGDDLERLVREWQIDEVIISMATASRGTLARTLAKCRRARVPAKIIPSLREILSGQVQISELRDTAVEEVLGRESIEVSEFEEVAGPTYRGKRILVTGAGGSIGSELVRQLGRLHPSKIAILDKDENAVYELDQELRRRGFPVSIETHIADVRETSRLRGIFSEFRPQAIFHAAAHKHVPLMEIQPCEAVLNNVGGTKNVLDVSAEFRVERLVFISTDKAVNPANVMGATKRIGEMLVQAQRNAGGMRVACVRFGNVLGSRGSVVPLFQKQIAAGGPVTVTHPDVVRYFMTIPEAVQLILCAGTLAGHGETFVLDMGNPRNILELAREMILLSGLEPEKDIHIAITGLRPGEKLTEELVAQAETLSPTSMEKLSVIEPQAVNHASLMADVARLLHSAGNNDRTHVLELLETMGLGYSTLLAPKAQAAGVGGRHVVRVLSLNPRPFTTPQESAL
ncbi:MAG: polysaccharide biosynthesis protein [Acidobacteriia bacterium]|nr:polysaccharide biosynthesis protein [Terriglobia bacterium]